MSTYQVRSLEEADQIIREHERKTKTTYALLRSTKNFGCVDVPGETLSFPKLHQKVFCRYLGRKAYVDITADSVMRTKL